MNEIASSLSGRFIAFDGPDGSGKSTQLSLFVQWCSDNGVVVTEVREPGGTSIGEQVRKILLDPENTDMTIPCEMLLYMASRAQLVQQTILPAMERGELVVADRFVSATLAYQGAAGGIAVESIQKVADVAVSGCFPDLTLILDVDGETAASRLNDELDRMELKGNEFHEKVRAGFLDQVRSHSDRYCVIDATQDAETVGIEIRGVIQKWFVSINSA
jgi:dTMP kinase